MTVWSSSAPPILSCYLHLYWNHMSRTPAARLCLSSAPKLAACWHNLGDQGGGWGGGVSAGPRLKDFAGICKRLSTTMKTAVCFHSLGEMSAFSNYYCPPATPISNQSLNHTLKTHLQLPAELSKQRRETEPNVRWATLVRFSLKLSEVQKVKSSPGHTDQSMQGGVKARSPCYTLCLITLDKGWVRK